MRVTVLGLTPAQQAQVAAISANSISAAAAAANIGDCVGVQMQANTTETTFSLPNKAEAVLGNWAITPDFSSTGGFNVLAGGIIQDVQPDSQGDPPQSTKSIIKFDVNYSGEKALGVIKNYRFQIAKRIPPGVFAPVDSYGPPVTFFNNPETHAFWAVIESQNGAEYRLFVTNLDDTTAIKVTFCNVLATRIRTY